MTTKPPNDAIPARPDGDFYARLGGWISGACLWRDNHPADELVALQADFPQFQIWPDATLDRLRYVSVSTRLDLNPHTVVTDSLAEMRSVLQSAQSLAPAPPGTSLAGD